MVQLVLSGIVERIENHEKYIELVLGQERDQKTFGADLKTSDVEEMRLLAERIASLYELRKKHELYLQKIMKIYCPNLLELVGTTIAARLIELGKGLKHLALLPASTVQLLGAEKALFRHIKTGSKSPKYGVIINHPFVQNAKGNEKEKLRAGWQTNYLSARDWIISKANSKRWNIKKN